ncbi:MAG: ferritin-like domain-containing protein [Deltaproteobacteria bacterium]
MDLKKVIEGLNKGLSLEYASLIQGLQHSFLVQGLFRESISPMLRGHAEESFKHAKMLGDKIVALGGLPTVEPSTVRQASDLTEMLKQDLELAYEVYNHYESVLLLVQDDTPLRVMIENLVEAEKEDCEELEKILEMKTIKVKDKELKFKAK